MAMITITTVNSVYVIDPVNKTWNRVKNHGDQHPTAPLRTEDGTYDYLEPMVVGEPMILTAPPLNPCAKFRMIRTSPIVSIVKEVN